MASIYITCIKFCLDTTNEALDDIAPDFTELANLETLIPSLQKHHLLTNDEAYTCQCHLIPPAQRARNLLQCLRRKGSSTLHK